MSEYVILEEETAHARTKEETDRKCPQCGGTMDFDPGSGGLACPFCSYVGEIETAGSAEELDFNTAESTGNCDWGVAKKTVICKSCGAESLYDELEISNECPYCGSNHVMEEKGVSTLAPGGVCPFRVDQGKAGANFHQWIKKKWFCPGVAKRKAQPESFKGVYLPYWTFDADTISRYTAQYGIDREVRGGDGKTKTVTDWYRTSGTHQEFIDDQLVLGSTQHERSLLARIEPFDTAGNVAYKPEYVAGFIAERYSIGLKDAWEQGKSAIQSRLADSIERNIKREKGADKVSGLNFSPVYSNITYKYLLLPSWLSSFTYKNKVYQFAVNGQTGRVGGKTPVSALRVLLAIGIAAAVLFLLYQWMAY